MKKIVSIIFMLIAALSFTGCQKAMYDEADYIEKARKEFNISDADTIEMKFIGEVTESKVLSKSPSCTYAHYHKAIKPKF